MEQVIENKEVVKKRGRKPKNQGVSNPSQTEKVSQIESQGPKKGILVLDDRLLSTFRSEEYGTLVDFEFQLQYQAKTLELLRRAVANQLKENLDFGTIPGTQKPSLWKPGAEKVANFLGFVPDFIATENTKIDLDRTFILKEYKCVLRSKKSGKEMGSCVGSCNSWESKYRYRWVKLFDVPWEIRRNIKTERATSRKGTEYEKVVSSPVTYKITKFGTVFKLENENIYDLLNTIDKMAQKRAFVGAVINASRLSIDFTQDLEDTDILKKTQDVDKESQEKPEEAQNAR